MFEFPIWVALIIGLASSNGANQGPLDMADSGSVPEITMGDDENGLMEAETDAREDPSMTSARAPEPQIASGKFTTALEVKPILTATKPNWVAVREYDGQDLLYFTQLLSWRCGVFEIRYSVNGGVEQLFDMEPCHLETAQPNGLTLENKLPFIRLVGGSLNSVKITLLYDDGTTDSAVFDRKDILMP